MYFNAIRTPAHLQNWSKFMCRYSDVDRSTSVHIDSLSWFGLELCHFLNRSDLLNYVIKRLNNRVIDFSTKYTVCIILRSKVC